MGHSWRTLSVPGLGVLLGLIGAASATAQVGPPPTNGRQIQAGDGDTVVIDGDDRVSLLRRRQAHLRVVADEAARTVLLIADWGVGERAQPDGRVNRTWRFAGIDGRWPLENRWEGDAILLIPERPPMSAGPALSIETPAGVVAFMGGPPREVPDASVVLRFESMSGGGRDGATFDEAEREALSPNFMTSFSTYSFGSGGGGYVAAGSAAAGANTVFETAVPPPGGGARTAGPILRAMPRILERVPPVWPQEARDAGVTGMVIVQADVSSDGSVRDARVLRGAPLLHGAAIDAVRRWRFEPAGADGRPDPVTVTVTVAFPPKP
jgi:TonB family protein